MRKATSTQLSEMLGKLNKELGRPINGYETIKEGGLKKHPGALMLDINIGGVHIDKLLKSGGCSVVSESIGRMKPKEAMIFIYGMFSAIELLKENNRL